jgi:hypothetical protein
MSPKDLNALAADFRTASESTRRETLARLLLDASSDDPSNRNLVAFAMALRGNGEMRWAEAAFAVAATIPHQRPIARYELAVLWSLQERLQPAIATFMEIWQERGLTPAQQFNVARQCARAGNFDKAKSILHACFEDTALYHEVIAELAFCDYLEMFPKGKVLALHEAITASHTVQSHQTVFERLMAALEAGQPMSVIRLGDGEGIYLQLSCSDESRFHPLYRRGRAEFHKIWYGGHDLLDDLDFIAQMRKVQSAYRNADCLSLLHLDGLHNQFTIGSPRGIPALTNMLRFLEASVEETPTRTVCEADVSRSLLVKGQLSQLLRSRPFVGLVSCYAQLPDLLRSHFAVGEVTLHRTCGEDVARQTLGEDMRNQQPARVFLANHHATSLSLKTIRPGQLYLVAAGIFGKLYCDMIKQGGGIALDIGSVADIWVNVPTRRFTREEKKHALA